jgi:hypothetical protein
MSQIMSELMVSQMDKWIDSHVNTAWRRGMGLTMYLVYNNNPSYWRWRSWKALLCAAVDEHNRLNRLEGPYPPGHPRNIVVRPDMVLN